MEPFSVTSALFAKAFGDTAGALLKRAAETHVTKFFGKGLEELAALGQAERDAAEEAVARAWVGVVDIILKHLQAEFDLDFEDEADLASLPILEGYLESLKPLMQHEIAAEQLLLPFFGDEQAPDAAVMAAVWKKSGGAGLDGFDWTRVTRAYRQRVVSQRLLDSSLRERLLAEEMVKLRRAVEEQIGYRSETDLVRYAVRMKEKYASLYLTDLGPSPSGESKGRDLRSVFEPQNVRANPPPYRESELPADVLRCLEEDGTLLRADPGDSDEHTTARMEQWRRSYERSQPRPVLEALTAETSRRFMLLGGPGSGKSTLARFLLLAALEQPEEEEPWARALEGCFPLLVELRQYNRDFRDGKCRNFLGHWHRLAESQHLHMNEAWLSRRLKDGPSLVLFDGLDEIVDGEEREQTSHAIVGFAGEYPEARVVVTSRPVGYRERILRDGRFTHFALQELDTEQIERFTRRWFDLAYKGRDAEAETRVQRVLSGVDRSASIALLAGNPMLLTIMAMIAEFRELPRERWLFYDQAAELLCHHWDFNRYLREEGVDQYLTVEDKKALLRRIAFYMQQGEKGLAGNVARGSDLEAEMRGFFEERFEMPKKEQIQLSRAMLRQLRQRNYILCLRGPDLYGFLHRTFLEYFSASEFFQKITKDPEYSLETFRDEVLARHWQDPEWNEVFRLVCGMLGEHQAVDLVDALLEMDPRWRIRRRPPHHLLLALACLGEIGSLPKVEALTLRVVDRLVDLLVWAVERNDFGLLKQLTELTRIPWPEKATVQFLRSGRKKRIDRGYEVVGFLDSDDLYLSEAIEPLLGRNRVRLENLATSKRTVERTSALRALADAWPDDETRTLLTRRAEEDSDGSPRSAALRALAGAWPDDETRTLLTRRAEEDSDGSPRSAALEALTKTWPDDETRTLLARRAKEDPDRLARSALLRTLARAWPDDETRALLARRAQEDPDGLVRSVALRTLGESWPDDETRTLLACRAEEDPDSEGLARRMALRALAGAWPDDETRTLLERRAEEDPHYTPRRMALHALADFWPDADTRALLVRQAEKDPDEFVRCAALEALVDSWPNYETRAVLVRRAEEDPSELTRSAVLFALAGAWPDDETRALLARSAEEDLDGSPRSTALRALAREWPGDETRALLTRRAEEEPDELPRRAALHALAEGWPDAETRALLARRAEEDPDEYTRMLALDALSSIEPPA